jgi:hypothetical protein
LLVIAQTVGALPHLTALGMPRVLVLQCLKLLQILRELLKQLARFRTSAMLELLQYLDVVAGMPSIAV